ncbi:MAG: hypothetical protein MRZ79_05170 [Bacteroidia bacterium]|nr:hypothetical protein [Bacteroidia bacterium]
MEDLQDIIQTGVNSHISICSQIGLNADFSLQSIADMDSLIDEIFVDGKLDSPMVASEHENMILLGFGSYLGEMIIRSTGSGAWAEDDTFGEGLAFSCVDLPAGLRIWPFQKVLKRINNGPEDSLRSYAITIIRSSEEKASE